MLKAVRFLVVLLTVKSVVIVSLAIHAETYDGPSAGNQKSRKDCATSSNRERIAGQASWIVPVTKNASREPRASKMSSFSNAARAPANGLLLAGMEERRKKDRLEQAMIPLLVAYKLKFAALVPTILGGLALLVSTTALAGFFFALFAAVLGLKTH
ncbi:uncharacterized protein LOC107263195 [Cephus cinctus]|uniref:Uncharacterized protein LOC107263195 n=1 Tax=Cephus cinctus TaxID=211228 RepID=A0AAJ7FCY5_CEPCN|nr:uncharacterized protein LOC107263195 [Cephus cinctus]